MLTEDFRSHLEHAITQALSNVRDKSLQRYWCDGVLDPEWEEDYLPIHVNNTRQIVARAWIDEGKTADHNAVQRVYQLVIKLGPKSFQAYMQGGSLLNFIPRSTQNNWVTLRPTDQIIETQLL